MSTTSPFDHRPDAELGAALRAALAPDDDAAFARRVTAAAERVWGSTLPGVAWWSVLTDWARPGLAAALVVVAVATFWLGRVAAAGPVGAVPLGDPLRSSSVELTLPTLLAEPLAPDLDAVLAVAMEP